MRRGTVIHRVATVFAVALAAAAMIETAGCSVTTEGSGVAGPAAGEATAGGQSGPATAATTTGPPPDTTMPEVIKQPTLLRVGDCIRLFQPHVAGPDDRRGVLTRQACRPGIGLLQVTEIVRVTDTCPIPGQSIGDDRYDFQACYDRYDR